MQKTPCLLLLHFFSKPGIETFDILFFFLVAISSFAWNVFSVVEDIHAFSSSIVLELRRMCVLYRSSIDLYPRCNEKIWKHRIRNLLDSLLPSSSSRLLYLYCSFQIELFASSYRCLEDSFSSGISYLLSVRSLSEMTSFIYCTSKVQVFGATHNSVPLPTVLCSFLQSLAVLRQFMRFCGGSSQFLLVHTGLPGSGLDETLCVRSSRSSNQLCQAVLSYVHSEWYQNYSFSDYSLIFL